MSRLLSEHAMATHHGKDHVRTDPTPPIAGIGLVLSALPDFKAPLHAQLLHYILHIHYLVFRHDEGGAAVKLEVSLVPVLALEFLQRVLEQEVAFLPVEVSVLLFLMVHGVSICFPSRQPIQVIVVLLFNVFLVEHF